jgi:hypothetical protein
MGKWPMTMPTPVVVVDDIDLEFLRFSHTFIDTDPEVIEDLSLLGIEHISYFTRRLKIPCIISPFYW